jgi:hypothetical protein
MGQSASYLTAIYREAAVGRRGAQRSILLLPPHGKFRISYAPDIVADSQKQFVSAKMRVNVFGVNGNSIPAMSVDRQFDRCSVKWSIFEWNSPKS